MRFFLVVSLVVGTLAALAQTPAFEVASIKQAPPPGSGPFRFALGPRPGGRWEAINQTLVGILREAYPGFTMPGQVAGGPDWINTTRFDINAVATGEPPREQIREMVRRLLAERFALKVRTESRQMDTYALVLARADGRLGPKLQKATIDCEARAAAIKRGEITPPPMPRAPGDPMLSRIECGMMSTVSPGTQTQRVVFSAQAISSLIATIQSTVGRPVVDRTGLTDKYEIELEFARQQGPGLAGAADVSPAASIFTAVQEQLGLKLEPRRELLDVLVIEHVQMPTPD